MTKRYSIFVVEYGSEREIELCQVDFNPESLVTALEEKTIRVWHSPGTTAASDIRKYNNIRVVDNHAVR